MLLAIDIGNTNIAIGLFALDAADPSEDRLRRSERAPGGAGPSQGPELKFDWRLETRAAPTGDEYPAPLSELFPPAGVEMPAGGAVVVSSVVPPVLFPIQQLCRRHFKVEPLVLRPRTKTGI